MFMPCLFLLIGVHVMFIAPPVLIPTNGGMLLKDNTDCS